MTLGNQVYTQPEAIWVIMRPSLGDASMILAKQLIAAKLNALVTPPPWYVAGQIRMADMLLAKYDGAVPYRLRPWTFDGRWMIVLAYGLDRYNNTCLP